MKKGKFIVLYGINNLGKTTQAKLLVWWLNGIGIPAKYLKYAIYDLEPTGPRLNAYLRDKNPEKLSPLQFQELQVKNREDFESELKKMLEQGTWIIAEDYVGTGVAWGTGKGVDQSLLEEMNAHLLDEDLALFFDGERFKSGIESIHTHEQDEILTQKVRTIHQNLAKKYGWTPIHANDPLEQVFYNVKTAVKAYFDIDEVRQPIKAIMAISENGIVGEKNENEEFTIPWSIPEDMRNFRKLTTNTMVIMGWNTWQSLPEKNRPLPNRLNVVLSTKKRNLPPGVIQSKSIDEALQLIESLNLPTFIMGGAKIYEAFEPYIDEWHLTMIEKEFQGTDFISLSPNFQANFLEEFGGAGNAIRWEKSEKNEYPAMYEVFKKIK